MTCLLPLLLLVSLLSMQVDADCCYNHAILSPNDRNKVLDYLCNDGTQSTPCCGNGGCNIFCCNCDGGCRVPPAGFQNGAGNVKWQWNCDYPGHDLSNSQTAGENCGQLCINTPGCNAFSAFFGTCYLKNVPLKSLQTSPAQGGVCGFLPWAFNFVY